MSSTTPDTGRQALRITRSQEAPEGWDALLGEASETGIFYSRAWLDAVQRHYPASGSLWLAAYQDGRLVGAVPSTLRQRFGLQRCYSGIEGTGGGPVVAGDLTRAQRERVCVELVTAYRALLGGRTVTATLSLPRAPEQEFGALLQGLPGWQRREILGAVIPVSEGLEHVEDHVLSNNRRNERNRALKRGCSAGAGNDPKLLAEFYPIYQAAAVGWGVEAPPLGLLVDLLTAPDSPALLIHVAYEGKVIGGHFCLISGERLLAWVGATMPEHNKRLFPATLIVWQEIVEACARGLAAVDLGGSGGITTLDRFKQLMGAQPEIRGHYFTTVPWLAQARRLRGALAGWRSPS